MKKYWKLGTVAIGAGLGFAYYRFIGCSTGACPITSNPWISIGYGALIGLALSWGNSKNKNEKSTV